MAGTIMRITDVWTKQLVVNDFADSAP